MLQMSEITLFIKGINIACLILGIVLNSWDSTAMHKFRRVFRKG
jgi:hypothetical protein